MDTPMSNLMFNGMAFAFKIRDLVSPRRGVLEEARLKPGDVVLDFGCGPGAYVRDAAEMVGPSGTVYALDLHPLAVERVRGIAEREGLANVETIHSSGPTGLPADRLDVVLMYDVFHMLSDSQAVLAEMHRVLKPGGSLSFNDPHMKEEDVIAGVTASGLFVLARRGERTYTFLADHRGRAS